MRKWRGVVVLALVLAGLQARIASATPVTVFSDFGGATDPYNPLSGWIVSGLSYPYTSGAYSEAMSFVPSGNYSFVSADVAAYLESGTNSITVTLAQDNSGAPGTAIESVVVSGKLKTGIATIVEADSVAHPTLDSGVKYWLEVSASDSTAATWDWNSTGVTGDWEKIGAAAWTSASGLAGAFSINGAAPAPVPELTSIALFATGMFTVIGFHVAHKRQAEKRSA